MSWALLTDDTILPGYETVVNYTGYERKEDSWIDRSINYFVNSTKKGHSKMYLQGLIVIFVLWVIAKTLLKRFYDAEEDIEIEVTSHNFWNELDIDSLKQYKTRAEREL